MFDLVINSPIHEVVLSDDKAGVRTVVDEAPYVRSRMAHAYTKVATGASTQPESEPGRGYRA